MTNPTPLLPPEVTKPVAYDYTRFSTKEQSAGDSERRQKDKAKQWADAHGYAIGVAAGLVVDMSLLFRVRDPDATKA